MTLSLEQANSIIEGALAKGGEMGLKPLTVAVLDGGGHLVGFQRSDGSSNLRPQIAIGKAAGAVSLGVNSRVIGEMAVERPHFIASLGPLASGGIVPVAGGVLIMDERGLLIGAVGVTGDTSDNDETAALAGIESAGLRSKE